MTARPERAYLPPALEHGRTWGIGLNLYALRSKRNWGIGDFTDLRDAVLWAKAAGAGAVGCNPLHALHYVEPEAASPYSPTTRYFRNPLYIDVEAVPEFLSRGERAAALRSRVASEPFQTMLAGLRDEPWVQYRRVARAKFSALEECYAILRESRGTRAVAFRTFCENAGERLETFAVHEALNERFAREDGIVRGWLTWPDDYRDRRGTAVTTFAVKNRRRVDYFKYLQWLAGEQLGNAARAATGMTVGLYLDLAVGVDANSADVWAAPESYVLGETIGAPPDPLGPLGQNWGLPPPDPAALERGGGAAFAELLRANMEHAGALRLDHVMALLRLFRIPAGHAPVDGAYHPYPFDTLLAAAARESHAERCAIVGEDLGTVPDGFRERMEREAILSYRVLLFEREDDGGFRPPAVYPALALATATTHDVSTLAGWVTGRDIATRQRIGLLDEHDAASASRERRVEASRLVDALTSAGTLDREQFDALHAALDAGSGEPSDYVALVRAAYAYLAGTPARLVLVQLDDVLLELDQINLPGTFVEYPNWRRKNSRFLEELGTDARISSILDGVRLRMNG